MFVVHEEHLVTVDQTSHVGTIPTWLALTSLCDLPLLLSVYFQMNNGVIEFRCVVTVSTPAVWLARENIKRLTPRLCINVEYSHGVV